MASFHLFCFNYDVMITNFSCAEDIVEKNWSPVGPVGQHEPDMYLFATLLEPHEIVQCHMRIGGKCDVFAVTSIKDDLDVIMQRHEVIDKAHLASNPILLSNGQFGAITHLRRLRPKVYVLYAYAFSPRFPYEITHFGRDPMQLPLPELPHTYVGDTICYIMSLMWVDGRLVISYGLGDQLASFFVMDEAEIFGNMVEVTAVNFTLF